VTAASLREHPNNPRDLEAARRFFIDRGFDIISASPFGFSLRMTEEDATRVLGSALTRTALSDSGYWSDRYYFERAPGQGAIEKSSAAAAPALAVVPPHLYFAGAIPPRVPFHHLRLADLPLLTGASALHRQGVTGRGIRIVLIDSGTWLNHPFFQLSRYHVEASAAADCHAPPTTDSIGHGTAMLANLLAIAPDAEVQALKAGNNLICAYRQAVARAPDIICLGAGYDLLTLCRELSAIPEFVRVFQLEIAAAAVLGIVTVAPVGNGHLAFPGMHPDVISAGGVYIDHAGECFASDYCSAYMAPWYDARQCPDICGLSGLHPAAAYIMSPVPRGSQIDRDAWDFTGPTDAWSVIGGSSLFAAHVAAACALVIQKEGPLDADALRALLVQHGSKVNNGEQNVICVDIGVSPPSRDLAAPVVLQLAGLQHV
jgi:hypothetical protein